MKSGWNGSETKSYRETISLGENLSYYLETGDVIGLTGDLASGKTTFIKGILKGFNYTQAVTSPTFTLINEYYAKYSVIHMDCYREDDLNRWIEVGFHDYLNSDNIVIIEWADKILSLLPKDFILIEFRHKGENKREIKLKN